MNAYLDSSVLHLATALAWQADQGVPLAMATHDKSLAQAARAYGMAVAGE